MSASSSPVIETVSRKRVVPAAELNNEKTTPDFYDFLEKMTDDDWISGDYMLAISREDPKPSQYGGINQLEVITDGTMQIAPGVHIKLNSREMLFKGIRQKYGGRAFRLWMKRGKQRVTEGKCMNELPPRMPTFEDHGGMPAYVGNIPLPGAVAPGNDSTAQVANKAIDTLSANQNPQLLNVAIDAVTRMASIVGQKPTESDFEKSLREVMLKRLLDPPAPPKGPDEIEQAFRTAIIARMTADPLESFTKLKDLFHAPQTDAVKQTLDVITALKQSGLLGGGGRGGVWELAASAVPVVASAAKEVMREWRLGMEAQERGVSVMRGASPMPPSVHAQLPPLVLPTPTPTAPPPAAIAEPQVNPNGDAPQVITGNPPLEWTEQKIVDIFKRGETVDSTVAYVLDFLAVSYPDLIPLLLDPPKLDARLKPGAEGLLMLFQARPVLRQIPANPRLSEFIHKFLERGREEQSAPPPPSPAPEPAPVEP